MYMQIEILLPPLSATFIQVNFGPHFDSNLPFKSLSPYQSHFALYMSQFPQSICTINMLKSYTSSLTSFYHLLMPLSYKLILFHILALINHVSHFSPYQSHYAPYKSHLPPYIDTINMLTSCTCNQTSFNNLLVPFSTS